MDSISQFVLGAAVGHMVVPQGRGRALVLGGLLATLPDLDVIVQYEDAIDSFTYHRSWSHSLFVLVAISPFVAVLVHKLLHWHYAPKPLRALALPPLQLSYRRCLMLVFFCFTTHPLLDAFTIYGTQIFWPLPLPPVWLGSIFIIDPLYTVPLIISIYWVWRNRLPNRSRVLVAGLVLSTSYLGWTVFAQQHAEKVARHALQARGIDVESLIVAPSPFSLLWRYVALDDHIYYEGYYSLLDRFSDHSSPVEFFAYVRGEEELAAASHIDAVKRMRWFTDDFVAASVHENTLVLSDLRMGLEGSYVFEFEVAQKYEGQWQAMRSSLKPLRIDGARVRLAAQRVFDPTVNLAP